MIKSRSIAVLTLVALFALPSATAFAAESGGHGPEIKRQKWSFSGITGVYDKQQLQRGFGVYKEVCAACHGLGRVAFRNLSEPGGPEFNAAQVKALAASYEVPAEPDDEGEVKPRPALASDKFPPLYANEKAARFAQNGALPPDFSVIARARSIPYTGSWYAHPFAMLKDIGTGYQEGGADYIYALLTGYKKAPAGVEVPDGMNYNAAFPGHMIAMASPLSADFGIYNDGTPETVDNYARDVVAFLSWTADPTLNKRKQMGWMVMFFLLITSILLYISKRRIWAGVKH
jgi:ubiquinol-cytochrome c reductase cytochrome c1 subunit